MIGCQRGGDWSRRGSLLTRFEKKSDQVLVLVVVTFDRVGIDLADVVSNGVTEKGKSPCSRFLYANAIFTSEYDSIATVGEIRVYLSILRRVLKKVF